MAKGFASAREAFAEIEARKNSGGGGGLYLKIDPGQNAVARFIMKEPVWAWVHALPKDGKSYRQEVCLDQDIETGLRTGEACPGCDKEKASGEVVGWKDREYRRHMSGAIQLIWRDAPVYEESENGQKNFASVVGKADQVVVWTVGKNVLEDLDGTAVTYKDLTGRDFVISRKGIKLDTTYDINPVLDEEGSSVPTPMSEADKALAAEAPSLDNKYRKPSYADWGKKKGSGSDSPSNPPATADVSPFMRKKETAAA